jgi:hypothetical protein
MISYNSQLRRHAFYFLRTNLEEDTNDNNKILFDKNFYSLNNFTQNKQTLN